MTRILGAVIAAELLGMACAAWWIHRRYPEPQTAEIIDIREEQQ